MITRLLDREHRVLVVGNAKYLIKKLGFRDWNGWAWAVTVYRNGNLVHAWSGKKLRKHNHGSKWHV